MVRSAVAMAVDLLDVPNLRNRRQFGLMTLQVARSEAITMRDAAGALCCVAGIYEYDDGSTEAWFCEGPALKANLLGVIRRLQVTMGELSLSGVEPFAYVLAEGVAGDRIAAMLGFDFMGLRPSPMGPLKTWRRFA